MTVNGERPLAPRLPDPGWLPDPSSTDVERYWDGRSWTARTRDRASKREHGVAPWDLQPVDVQPWQRGSVTRSRRQRGGSARLIALTAILIGLLFTAAHVGILPEWVPMRSALVGPQPTAPQVAYPVFGSDDLVKYLAASMIAQEPTIDVTYWANQAGVGSEGIFDAINEASVQNPYLFVDAWTYATTLRGVVVTPEYAHDATEAAQRRVATAAAVSVGLKQAGVTSEQSEQDKVREIHDYVASVATYDSDAAAAITAGATDSSQVEESQEAYGILVGGSAVCNGYAQAFQAMAQAAGIDTVIVTGNAWSGATSGPHAWNRVLVDGQWLTVDVTWDDADSWGTQEEYLLLNAGDPALATRSADLDWVVDTQAGNYGA